MRDFLRAEWRILALGILALLLMMSLWRSRNDHRFVQEGDKIYILDTRTGQACDPFPQGNGRLSLPKCADLAKGWR